MTFDPLNSEKGIPLTFEEILDSYGYNWDYEPIYEERFHYSKRVKKKKKLLFKVDTESSAANRMNVVPPRGGR